MRASMTNEDESDDTRHAHLVSPGAALREIRTEQRLKLSDVSERTGIPVSTLSKIETGKSEVTMDRLLKISVALRVNIADLFRSSQAALPSGGRTRRSVTRLGDAEVVHSPYGSFAHHAQDLLDKRIMPIVADIHAHSLAELGEFHRHDGEEYVYVLQGELALYTDTYTPVCLSAGEAIYFDSTMGHAYVAVSESCKILIICAPTEMSILEGSAKQGDSDRLSRLLHDSTT